MKALWLAALSLAGCASLAPEVNGADASPQPPATMNPIAASALPAEMWGAIRADAATRAGVAPEAVNARTVQGVTWNDGSLGCPQPGRMYTQALVPGWRIEVQAGSGILLYHASRRGGWVQCPAERARAPGGGANAV